MKSSVWHFNSAWNSLWTSVEQAFETAFETTFEPTFETTFEPAFETTFETTFATSNELVLSQQMSCVFYMSIESIFQQHCMISMFGKAASRWFFFLMSFPAFDWINWSSIRLHFSMKIKMQLLIALNSPKLFCILSCFEGENLSTYLYIGVFFVIGEISRIFIFTWRTLQFFL